VQEWPVDGPVKEVTEQRLVQSAGRNVQLASTSLQGQPVRRWRRRHALAGVPMGNSLAPEPTRRQRLCLRLRGADPAFQLTFRGRSSDGQERSLVRREAAGSNPVVPAHGGRGVDGSTRGCEPRRRRFEPGRPPFSVFLRALEHRRAQQAVTLSPRAVVVRLHPSAPWGCSSTGESTSLATRQMSVRLRPSPPFASVVSTASTRPLYGRGAGSTPAGGSFRRP
jgi:hypothetical protein